MLASDWPFPENVTHPNRMPPHAALSFLLLGPALLLAPRSRRLARVGLALALAVIALGVAALIGYLYDAAFLYRVGTAPQLSPYAALCLVALGSGVLALRADLSVPARMSDDGIGTYLARRLLPPVVAIPLALDWLRLQGQSLGWWDAVTGHALDALLYIAISVALVLYLARSLDVLDVRPTASTGSSCALSGMKSFRSSVPDKALSTTKTIQSTGASAPQGTHPFGTSTAWISRGLVPSGWRVTGHAQLVPFRVPEVRAVVMLVIFGPESRRPL